MTRRTLILAGLLLALLAGDLFAQRRMDRKETLIYNTYVTFLQREPNPVEMAQWRAWARGRSMLDLEAQILASEEHFAYYGKDVNRFTRALYQQYLGRLPDGQELAHWSDYFFNVCGQERGAFTHGFLRWVHERR